MMTSDSHATGLDRDRANPASSKNAIFLNSSVRQFLLISTPLFF